jgi:hypothetical protein
VETVSLVYVATRRCPGTAAFVAVDAVLVARLVHFDICQCRERCTLIHDPTSLGCCCIRCRHGLSKEAKSSSMDINYSSEKRFKRCRWSQTHHVSVRQTSWAGTWCDSDKLKRPVSTVGCDRVGLSWLVFEDVARLMSCWIP